MLSASGSILFPQLHASLSASLYHIKSSFLHLICDAAHDIRGNKMELILDSIIMSHCIHSTSSTPITTSFKVLGQDLRMELVTEIFVFWKMEHKHTFHKHNSFLS